MDSDIYSTLFCNCSIVLLDVYLFYHLYLCNKVKCTKYLWSFESKPILHHLFLKCDVIIFIFKGIGKAANGIYKQLHIGQLQLDSLGYLQCWPLFFTGHIQLASQLFDSTMKFFAHSNKIVSILLNI